MPNTLYVEGYALDRFAEGAWALQPVHQNKVSGTLLTLISHTHTNHFAAIVSIVCDWFNLGRPGIGLRNRGGAPAPPPAGRGCRKGFARPPCRRVRCHRCSFGGVHSAPWTSSWQDNLVSSLLLYGLPMNGVDQDVVRSEMWEINGECWELWFSIESGWRAGEPFGGQCCGGCCTLSRWWSWWFRLLSRRKGISGYILFLCCLFISLKCMVVVGLPIFSIHVEAFSLLFRWKMLRL